MAGMRRNIEMEVFRMGDVGVAIDMVDAKLSDGDKEKTERAVTILREVFDDRYDKLVKGFYGGDGDD